MYPKTSQITFLCGKKFYRAIWLGGLGGVALFYFLIILFKEGFWASLMPIIVYGVILLYYNKNILTPYLPYKNFVETFGDKKMKKQYKRLEKDQIRFKKIGMILTPILFLFFAGMLMFHPIAQSFWGK